MFAESIGKMMTTVETPGDYVENGILMCGRCGTPKQVLLSLPALTGTDTPQLFPVACHCQQEASAKAEAERQAAEFRARMGRLWGGVHDPELMVWHFEDDGGGQAAAITVAKRYCEKWPEMLKNNVGILIYGPVGVGKSFIASCVANELLRRRVTVCATGLSRIMNCLQATFEKQEVLDKLGRFQMLFLDDIGAERNTSFSTEQVFSVIDARYRQKRPIICTTNLPLRELENPENLSYSRIYDRLLEMCPVRLAVTGPSRRAARAEQRRELARKLLL